MSYEDDVQATQKLANKQRLRIEELLIENAALRALLAEAISDVARNDLGADQDSLYHRMKVALETEGHSQRTDSNG